MKFAQQAKRILDNEELTPEEKVKDLQERLEDEEHRSYSAAKKVKKVEKEKGDFLLFIHNTVLAILAGFLGFTFGKLVAYDQFGEISNYYLKKQNESADNKIALEKAKADIAQLSLPVTPLKEELAKAKDELAKTKSELEAAKAEQKVSNQTQQIKNPVAASGEKQSQSQEEKSSRYSPCFSVVCLVAVFAFSLVAALISYFIAIETKSSKVLWAAVSFVVVAIVSGFVAGSLEAGQVQSPTPQIVCPAPISTQGETEKPNPKPWY